MALEAPRGTTGHRQPLLPHLGRGISGPLGGSTPSSAGIWLHHGRRTGSSASLTGLLSGRASPTTATSLEDRMEELLQGGETRRNAFRQVARENMEAEVREGLSDTLYAPSGHSAHFYAEACGRCCGLFVICLMLACVTIGTCCSVLQMVGWLLTVQLIGCQPQFQLRAWLLGYQVLCLIELLLACAVHSSPRAIRDVARARVGQNCLKALSVSCILLSSLWKVLWCFAVQGVAASMPQDSDCGAWLPHYVRSYSYLLLWQLLAVEPFARVSMSLMMWTARNGMLETTRRAKPGTLDSLTVVPYDRALFADERDLTDDRPQDECCICLDSYSSSRAVIIRTPCGHMMHRECLRSWLQTSHFCPLCRADLEENRL